MEKDGEADGATNNVLFQKTNEKNIKKGKAIPLQARGPRGFQEVKVPRFHDNGTGWW